MITIADLDRVLDMMPRHGLQTLRVREGEALLALKLATSVGPSAIVRDEVVVRTKALGRLRLTHPQKSTPEVHVGDKVTTGTILAFLENDQVLLPVLAEKSGEVLRLKAAEGSFLGFGAPVVTLSVEA